jgi:hypothetical protein
MMSKIFIIDVNLESENPVMIYAGQQNMNSLYTMPMFRDLLKKSCSFEKKNEKCRGKRKIRQMIFIFPCEGGSGFPDGVHSHYWV